MRRTNQIESTIFSSLASHLVQYRREFETSPERLEELSLQLKADCYQLSTLWRQDMDATQLIEQRKAQQALFDVRKIYEMPEEDLRTLLLAMTDTFSILIAFAGKQKFIKFSQKRNDLRAEVKATKKKQATSSLEADAKKNFTKASSVAKAIKNIATCKGISESEAIKKFELVDKSEKQINVILQRLLMEDWKK